MIKSLGKFIIRAIARLIGEEENMATTQALVLTFWHLDNNTYDIAIKAALNTASDVDWTEFTQPNDAVDGELALGYCNYRNSNEFPTLTAGTSPALAPASCRHFLIAHKTQGGDSQNYVTNYDEAIGTQGLSDLLDWLAVWYPNHRNTVAGTVTAASTHKEAAFEVAKAANPAVPPFPI